MKSAPVLREHLRSTSVYHTRGDREEHVILCCETLFPKFQSEQHGIASLFNGVIEWSDWENTGEPSYRLSVHPEDEPLTYHVTMKGTNHAEGL